MSERYTPPEYEVTINTPHSKPFNVPVEIFDVHRELEEIDPLPRVSEEDLRRKRDKAFGR